jgi:LPS export ABC transporter protein LptC
VADTGRISSAGDAGAGTAQTIDLSGAVEVSSVDEYGNKMLMSTDYLSVDPQLETLQTDRPVTVVTNTVQQTSIGMFADLQTDEIILLDDIRGSYARPEN